MDARLVDLFRRHETRDRLAMLGDRHLFASRHPIQKLRQVSLRLKRPYGDHEPAPSQIRLDIDQNSGLTSRIRQKRTSIPPESPSPKPSAALTSAAVAPRPRKLASDGEERLFDSLAPPESRTRR